MDATPRLNQARDIMKAIQANVDHYWDITGDYDTFHAEQIRLWDSCPDVGINRAVAALLRGDEADAVKWAGVVS